MHFPLLRKSGCLQIGLKLIYGEGSNRNFLKVISSNLPIYAAHRVEVEIKICKFNHDYRAKFHLALSLEKTLCGRKNPKWLRKARFDFGANCCKFCCEVAVPLKLAEMRGSKHIAIAGTRPPLFSALKRSTSQPQR